MGDGSPSVSGALQFPEVHRCSEVTFMGNESSQSFAIAPSRDRGSITDIRLISASDKGVLLFYNDMRHTYVSRVEIQTP